MWQHVTSSMTLNHADNYDQSEAFPICNPILLGSPGSTTDVTQAAEVSTEPIKWNYLNIRALIQYKDAILPVKEIPLWR